MKIISSNAKLRERISMPETIVERYERRRASEMTRGNLYIQLDKRDKIKFDKGQLAKFNAEAELRRVNGEEF